MLKTSRDCHLLLLVEIRLLNLWKREKWIFSGCAIKVKIIQILVNIFAITKKLIIYVCKKLLRLLVK